MVTTTNYSALKIFELLQPLKHLPNNTGSSTYFYMINPCFEVLKTIIIGVNVKKPR